jgi:hypothetical protein
MVGDQSSHKDAQESQKVRCLLRLFAANVLNSPLAVQMIVFALRRGYGGCGLRVETVDKVKETARAASCFYSNV